MRIQLLGNIEFPSEVEQCEKRGADGIGLYRTEFLFMSRDDEPTEEEQIAAYSRSGRGDEGPAGRDADARPGRRQDAEPAGSRGRAQSVPRPAEHSAGAEESALFRMQLRAILRASVAGNIRIMFPLMSTLLELRQAKMVLADAMEDLDEEGVPFDRNMQGRHDGRGAVGRDDDGPLRGRGGLLQHRHERPDPVRAGGRPQQQGRGQPVHGGRSVGAAADRHGGRRRPTKHDVPISMCGQMCGNPLYTMLLLGIGLRSLSVTPSAIPEIKRVCRSVSLEQCERVAEQALELESARDVKTYLKEELSKVFPEFPVVRSKDARSRDVRCSD